jgi:quinol monooxygenase YgiN
MTLIRVVRMTFQENEIESFLKVFEENKAKIRAFPGCSHLELHRDIDNHNILATYSLWSGSEALDEYRKSELFKSVWSRTKRLFADKPVAFSHEVLQEV